MMQEEVSVVTVSYVYIWTGETQRQVGERKKISVGGKEERMGWKERGM